jgi:hypothetical protein
MEMRQNLDYYQTMSGVKETDFKDLEAKPHMVKKTISFSLSLFLKFYLFTFSFWPLCVCGSTGDSMQGFMLARQAP